MYVTNSMHYSPSREADSHPAGQEIPYLLWNLNVNYCVHNSLALVLIQGNMDFMFLKGPFKINIESWKLIFI
jgi:hypothetical protein